MEIARLGIVLSAEESKRQARELSQDLQKVGTAADKASTQAQGSFRKMSTGISGSQREIAALSNALRATQTTLASFDSALVQATRSMQGLGTASGGAAKALGGAGGTGGTSGGGSFAGAAGASVTAANALTGALRRLVLQFASLEAARRFVVASVEASIAFENIRNVLSLVSGSAKEAREQFVFLQRESDRIGVNFRDAANRFARFEAAAKGSGISLAQLKETFIVVSEAGRRFGLSAAEQSRIFIALQQMVSKGVVSMEELRQQLGETLPGAFGIAARAMGLTTREFSKLVESGKLETKDFLGPFTRELAKFAPAGQAVASTAAELNKLKNAWDRFLASQGIQVPVKFAAKAGTSLLDQFTTLGPEEKKKRDAAISQLRSEGFFRNTAEAAEAMVSDQIARDIEAVIQKQIAAMEHAALRNKQGAERFLANFPGGLTRIGLDMFSELQRRAAPPDPEQIAKNLKEQNKLTLESLDGREKIVETWRQEEERLKGLGLTILQTEERIKQARALGAKELGEFDQKEFIKNLEESEAAAKKLHDMTVRLTVAGMEPLEAATRKVHEAFNEDLLDMIVLEEQGYDTAKAYAALIKARDKALENQDDKRRRNKFRFIGEETPDLRKEIQGAEQTLLRPEARVKHLKDLGFDDEKIAKDFQDLTTDMQDRSAELARRMKADAVTVREAWSVGWEQQVKQYGSAMERIAQISAGLADTLDRNFTDAFSSMILGTKSAADAFKQMANAIISDITRILVRQLIVAPALQSLGAGGEFGGSSGGGFLGLGSLFGGSTASAGSGTAASFGAGAGAAAGFTQLNRSVERVADVAGRQKSVNITLINASNPRDIDDHLAANPQAILNPITRNASTVRRLLA